MSIANCRVCGGSFFETSLLHFKNMPKQAQNFPDKKDLAEDKGVDLTLCQCSACGLVQLSDEPVSYYKEVIRAAAFSPEMGEFRLKQFKDFLTKYKLENKKVLEVGCGKGEYLSLMKAAGADAFGIEFGQESVAVCQEEGLAVERLFIEHEDEKVQAGPFDAFFIMSYLEHLPDLNSTLRGIAKNLNPGGVGLVEVPNYNMILRENLFSEFISDHLFYFTKDTLITTLNINGFEVIECQDIWHDYIISATVKKRSKQTLSHFYKIQEKLKNELNGFIDQYGVGNVAIWGAGHQALAVMALAELGDKIRYVVDSADFKQNKFTPSTHVPIVAPLKLEEDPVKAIIVIAGSYSGEVVRIIKNKYEKVQIAVLTDTGLECK